MTEYTLQLILVVLFSAFLFFVSQKKALSLQKASSKKRTASRPFYYGMYAALWGGIPALLILLIWQLGGDTLLLHISTMPYTAELESYPAHKILQLQHEIRWIAEQRSTEQVAASSSIAAEAAVTYSNLKEISSAAAWVVIIATGSCCGYLVYQRIAPSLKARTKVEQIIRWALITSSSIAILTTVGIVLAVLYESLRFFALVPVSDFLFGLVWSPQTALRADQVGSSGSFGAIPVFTGTLMVSGIAMLVSVPVGLMSAIYLSEFASYQMRSIIKPALEILAGIPTVVYGFFAALIVAPFIRRLGEQAGLSVSSESALAAGLVMGIMIIPFISSLSDDFLNAVPQSLRDGAYSLGSTQSETIRHVLLPAALPGIAGGILLGLSRAIGETMIVVMAAGLAANLTLNPLETVTTVTVQIVTLLVGDQEFESAKTLAAFALGLLLFIITLILNIIALTIVRTYREEYD
ncbi:phosphate ABC transporter permease subunit PstC [Prosthecochloris sp. HL-130-GSB]|jgi:phosphate transport system permease protein|uniref:phosphate ABC transporter permease subunit PstC n=1 Tax=Prosthecochloris sp. HL-130-GSB TaxID=1974213 RepID=UPI000A1C0CFA|nr:phosphate ABC transporter permease subunit PstC [Prosthecochloris sp. HL-130-GSB]ARM31308.1 phosphate ABC transporter permease subunit PstC [Prosthecochloris sp. HL-130-GSB]